MGGLELSGGGLQGAMLSDGETDALFAHLQELVERLPYMQDLSARLVRARAADAVLACHREAEAAAKVLAEADAQLERAQAELRVVQGGDNTAAVDHKRREVLYCGQQRGLRVGPARNTQAKLERALAEGGFVSVEDAAAAALLDGKRAKIEQEIIDYQADYTRTLAVCERMEGGRE